MDTFQIDSIRLNQKQTPTTPPTPSPAAANLPALLFLFVAFAQMSLFIQLTVASFLFVYIFSSELIEIKKLLCMQGSALVQVVGLSVLVVVVGGCTARSP